MRTKLIGMTVAALGAVGLAATSASAADYLPPSKICIPMQPADLLNEQDNGELTKAVVEIMNEAVATSREQTVIDSRRVAWTWATEAKVACGKAYGYLQSNYRDEQYINQCECFFRRMQHYLH